MRSPWTRFARIGFAVFAVFALLELAREIHFAVAQEWPGGFFLHARVMLASWLGGLHWYLPVGALAGGVAAAASSRVRRYPRLWEVILACTGLALLSFALRGFIGPHLLYHARGALIDAPGTTVADPELAAALRPNDWTFFRTLAAQGVDDPTIPAMVHSTVAFAILSAVVLPLGLAIGYGSQRFLGSARRRAAWAMAAATTALVYAAQVGSGWVAPATAWTAAVIYLGFLTVPLVMLLALAWSGTAWPSSDQPNDRFSSGPAA